TLRFSFIFFTAIHISKIVIAGIYYNKCPVEPDIPKYLLALGILGIATKLITLFRECIMKFIQVSPFISVLTTAELAVLIVASYYVYREFQPSYDPDDGMYCNKTLYLFSFVYITILYSLLLLCIIAVGCFITGLVIIDKYVPREENGERATEAATEELFERKK
ncbi:uncharacterized protein BDFB_004998, partial [Asbolus verrucosus]